MLPDCIIGTKTAPLPSPFTTKVGGELYSTPGFRTNAEVILPSSIVKPMSPFSTDLNVMFGCS